MKKKGILFGSIVIGLLILITPYVNSIEHQNQKTSELEKTDNPSFMKKMVERPYWYFGIAFGDFYVNGNVLEGHAKIVLELYMNHFIFPETNIYSDIDIGANILSDAYFYYKLIYTNHTVIIFAIELKYPHSPPDIACSKDSINHRLIVVMADADIKWSDIGLTLDKPGATYQVFAGNGTAIATVNNTDLAGDAEVLAGDYIQLSNYHDYVTITMVYIPLNILLGVWTFTD